MSSVTLTEAQSAQIPKDARAVELRDPQGRVLAVALSAEEYRQYIYATARNATTDDELNRLQTEFAQHGGVTTDQPFAQIRKLGIPGAGRP